MRVIDMTVDQLIEMLTANMDKNIKPLEERIEKLEQALALKAPSFDISYAALYCGNKSKAFIQNLVSQYNLPRIYTVSNSPRYLKAHLDHFLKGGEFTPDGKMIPLSETEMKRTG